MVRKRTRKYESEDNDSDSDIEFSAGEDSPPAAKKYSLRERKNTSHTTADFDYYGLDEEEGELKKGSSDDEDFEVEEEPAPPPARNRAPTTRTFYEPELEAGPENSDGLIDFEDIIRADIVVNKNKIDYDNLIQKTEIKLSPSTNEKPATGKRRGRKPKYATEQQQNADSPTEAPVSNTNELESSNSRGTEETPTESQSVEKSEKKLEPANGEDLEGTNNEESPSKDTEGDPLQANGDKVAVNMQENLEEEESTKTSEIDDDVIVLEVKQDVIVLDD